MASVLFCFFFCLFSYYRILLYSTPLHSNLHHNYHLILLCILPCPPHYSLLSYTTLSYLTLPYPTLLYFALLHPTLPTSLFSATLLHLIPPYCTLLITPPYSTLITISPTLLHPTLPSIYYATLPYPPYYSLLPYSTLPYPTVPRLLLHPTL